MWAELDIGLFDAMAGSMKPYSASEEWRRMLSGGLMLWFRDCGRGR